ncbi:MAG TPA: MauE/DoxX family redox-associated membrane protein [Gemmataceae bacterium]|jgi:hypothetical protein
MFAISSKSDPKSLAQTTERRAPSSSSVICERKSRAFAVIRIVLGILLLSAAGLKIYGWSVTTVPPVGWFSAPGVQAAAIGWEILLGAWLLCGVAPFGLWLASIGTFTLLAGISGYLGWIGQATCGCFGTIKTSPWHVFAVDVSALGLLAVGHPRWEFAKTVREGGVWRSISPFAYFVVAVGVIIACLMGMGTWVYGSPQAALAHLRGESIVAKPEFVDFGTGKSGERLEADVEVQNWSDRPVWIYGGTSGCSCVVTKGLPITIPPGESRRIPMILKVPRSAPGTFTRYADLCTDSDKQRNIHLRVGCHVE